MKRRPDKCRCRECHVTATYGEVEQRPAAVLHLDGTIERFVEIVTVYWCDNHSGIKATP